VSIVAALYFKLSEEKRRREEEKRGEEAGEAADGGRASHFFFIHSFSLYKYKNNPPHGDTLSDICAVSDPEPKHTPPK
jgi:hypothetical protein